ncbi:hypothetical protein [Methylobacterium platani]|uniref:Cytotoxic translational repressor of toxin-antitoxin stability system n=2 Tax=Methylobacterium platani TaxID=427683 RepID=A0A179S0W6_9HYPH|nr:hypothetical protein [Methylobacterium platani]KMO15087.1 hypothetical protein SQ03_17905 [Methylobacterium platani JCM 14648]OAS14777.1 hypothetical protein A5481_30135 [Methylobacterium platani]
MSRTVTPTPAFIKASKSLPPHRQKAAAWALSKFMRDPILPSLDFRSLAGASGYHIIDPGSGDRIILRRLDDEAFEAVDVGPHDNIYRAWNRR